MKKSILTLIAIAAAQVVMADWLLWQVCESDYQDVDGIDTDDIAALQIGYVTKGKNVNFGQGTLFQNVYTAGGSLYDSAEGEMPGPVDDLTTPSAYDNKSFALKVNLSEIDGSAADYSYYVELLNSSGEVVARTAANSDYSYATYASLSSSVASGSIGAIPQASVWHGGSFEAVPEPSSMALLALGAGLVGLRRKLKKGKKAQKEKCA